MKIKLKNTTVEYFSISANKSVEEDDLDLAYNAGYQEDNLHNFAIKFDVKVQSLHGYEIELAYIAYFETDEEVDNSFMESTFPIVNAPAIAYPYMRSFISLVTLNSGFDPLILPTVNFQAIAQAQKKKESSLNSEDEVKNTCSQKE